MLKDGSFLSGGKDRKITKWEYSEDGYKKSSQEHEVRFHTFNIVIYIIFSE